MSVTYNGTFDCPGDLTKGEHVVIRITPVDGSGVRYLECIVHDVVRYGSGAAGVNFVFLPLTIDSGMTDKQMFGRFVFGDAGKDRWPFSTMSLAASVAKGLGIDEYEWMRLARTASVMAAEYPDGLVCSRCNSRNPHAGASHLKNGKYTCYECR